MKFHEFFGKIDEFNFEDFKGFLTFGVSEVHNEQSVPEFGDDQPIGISDVGEGEMGVSDETRSSGPVVGGLQISAIDEFKFIKELVFIGIVIEGVEDDSSFSIE